MTPIKHQKGLLEISIIAAELGITHQRVSQILAVALRKFKKALAKRKLTFSDIV
jgi:DNA-directed RNA polymerase sigma subunit (sigma70/sigma32)